jgi:hypothetical protein
VAEIRFPKLKDDTDAFWARVSKGERHWTIAGLTAPTKPPVWQWQGVRRSAIWISYTLCLGKIPDHLIPISNCGTHVCLNPNHIILVTPKELRSIANKRKRSSQPAATAAAN